MPTATSAAHKIGLELFPPPAPGLECFYSGRRLHKMDRCDKIRCQKQKIIQMQSTKRDESEREREREKGITETPENFFD